MVLARREMLSVSIAALLWPQACRAQARVPTNSAGLAAGRFVWEPSQPQHGAVVLAVTLDEQLLHVYKAGALIGISTCRAARGTRAGIYAIADPPPLGEKAGEEADPLILRWSGRLLHAATSWGQPGAPDTVWLPVPFARLLGRVTPPGTLAVVVDRLTRPAEVAHPQSLLPLLPAEAGRQQLVNARPLTVALDAVAAPSGTVIVISGADRSARLLGDGQPERRARIRFEPAGGPIGTHVFSLIGGDGAEGAMRWLGFGVAGSRLDQIPAGRSGETLLEGITFEDRASAVAMARSLHPGAILIVTDSSPTGLPQRAPQRPVVLAAEGAQERPAPSRPVRPTLPQPPEQDAWSRFFPIDRR